MHIDIKQEPVASAAEKIFQLDQIIFVKPLSFPSKNIEEIKTAFRSCAIFMAYDRDHAVGFSAHEKREDGTVLIKAVGILPSYRGKGIGTQLMARILQEANNSIFHLHTHPHNIQAIKFYWKFGFTITGWKSDYFGPGEHRLLLERKGKLNSRN